jgi:hypothetical protein
MNSFIVKIFVTITEILGGLLIGTVVLVGINMVYMGDTWRGLSVAIGGTLIICIVFGIAAIFIEIHKNILAVRNTLEEIGRLQVQIRNTAEK